MELIGNNYFRCLVIITLQTSVLVFSGDCQEREPTTKEKRLLTYNKGNLPATFSLIPEWGNHTLSKMLNKIKKGGGKTGREWLQRVQDLSLKTPLTDNTACPDIINASARHPMDRSTCPWYVAMNYDERRWPKVMLYAQCKCDNCVRKSTEYPNLRGVSSNICQPVYSYPYFLRRKCKNGEYTYYPVPEKTAIGCTCVVPLKTSA